MSDPQPFIDVARLLSGDATPPRKQTLAAGDGLFLGLNVHGEGDGQPPHTHDDQDKAYVVVEGEGDFTVGPRTERCGAGTTVWAPAGVVHGVVNPGPARLVTLVFMGPPPGGRGG